MAIIKDRLPFKVKLMLYNSLAESYIQYGLTSYGRTYTTYLNQIYNLQLRILKKMVSNTVKQQFNDYELGLFEHCKVLPVHTQFKYMMLRNYFFDETIRHVVSHPIHTRAVTRNLLVTSRANNAYGERTASYLVPRLINELPMELLDTITPKNIKHKLRSYFLSNLHQYQGVGFSH